MANDRPVNLTHGLLDVGLGGSPLALGEHEQRAFGHEPRVQRVLDGTRGTQGLRVVQALLEQDAFDAEGRLRQSKATSINKIGHALHDLDPTFDRFSRQPAIADAATTAGLARYTSLSRVPMRP